ncbi:MAG: hypothetical protein H8E72_09610 [Candidatus Marinimicrobia bacterium]|nr:hypothetical protein [Candidatus Neomarinimicrobiota bacterium]
MQNFKKYSIIVLVGIGFSQGFEPGLGNFIPITPPLSNTEMGNVKSNFSMNHGFSLMANSGTFGSTTMGVYSNQVKYDFSNKLSLKSTFHFMNSNQSFYTNNQNLDVKYELGLEYNLSENSRIFFQFSNLGNPQRNSSYMFTPGF